MEETGHRRIPIHCTIFLMLRFVIAAFLPVAFMAVGGEPFCAAQINVDVHLDKERYLAGEPAYLVWEYTNIGSTPIPFDRFDPYCVEPTIDAPSLALASPAVFPYPINGIIDCESLTKPLRPRERYVTKYLLNHRFNLGKAGTYELIVPLQSEIEVSGQKLPLEAGSADVFKLSNPGEVGTFSLADSDHGSYLKKITLILRAATEEGSKNAYQPYLDVLRTPGRIDRAEAVRALADSQTDFTENTLLQISSDPRNDSYIQSLANEGLARLRTPAGCARLAELAAHPELHHQQRAIEELGQCGDPEYMMFLFGLADLDSRQRDFALRAAAEAGGDAAVERLLNLASQGSLVREAALYALGLTGSERAVKALIDALPSLPDYVKFAALASLRTLTHHESKQRSYDAQVKEWQQWWANPGTKEIYKPRDWSTTAPLQWSAREQLLSIA